MKKILGRLLRETSGATAIEYVLIAAGISVAIITVLSQVGSGLQTVFSNVTQSMANAGK